MGGGDLVTNFELGGPNVLVPRKKKSPIENDSSRNDVADRYLSHRDTFSSCDSQNINGVAWPFTDGKYSNGGWVGR